MLGPDPRQEEPVGVVGAGLQPGRKTQKPGVTGTGGAREG